jgi:hypothetical protein
MNAPSSWLSGELGADVGVDRGPGSSRRYPARRRPRVATKTISGLYDGATTAELDRLSIQTAAEMTGEEPQYSRLAARLLAGYIGKEVRGQGIASFSQSVSLGHAEG